MVGCASSGNKVLKQETEQTVQSKIKKGVTTKNQIRQMFGSPLSTTFTDGGSEIWKYEFETTQPGVANFIPVVNWFGMTNNGTKKELVILFQGNKVHNFSMSESQISTGTGIFQ